MKSIWRAPAELRERRRLPGTYSDPNQPTLSYPGHSAAQTYADGHR